MAKNITWKVVGAEQVAARFRALPDRVSSRLRRRVIGRAGRAVANAAKGFAPVDQGYFRQSQGVRTRSYDRGDRIIAVVGSRRGEQFKGRANIAHLLEQGWRIVVGGTAPPLRPGYKAKKSKVTGERGKGIVVGRHPGFQVMERAHAATRGHVQEILTHGALAEIDAAVREVARGV